MITRALLATIFVGLFTGFLMTAVQQWRVVPLIVAAEAFEAGVPAAHQHGAVKSNLSLVSSAYAHGADADLGPLGISRLSGTLVANFVTFTGFALVLFGLSTLLGQPITVPTALAWGACGWLAVHFLPAVGLPPELPGFPAAELQARQIWWASTVIISVVGLAVLAFKNDVMWRIGGMVLLVLPHIYGAPQPEDITTLVPALYAAEYSVAALTASLISWLVMALGLGMANERLAKVIN